MSEGDLSGAEGNVQPWHVAEDSDECGLEEKSEIAHLVSHALLRQGEVSSLADHEISPLDADDGYEVTGLGHLEGL